MSTDPIAQAVAEAHPNYGMSSHRVEPYCTGCGAAISAVDGSVSLGWVAHVAEAAIAATLGEGQCCPDVCNGGACETCPSCCAGWCINGHDFTPGVWESMSAEDRRTWLDVASEHNPALAVAQPLIEAQALRKAADAWTQGHWSDDLPPQGATRSQLILGMAQRARDWLRDRADEIEAAGGAS